MKAARPCAVSTSEVNRSKSSAGKLKARQIICQTAAFSSAVGARSTGSMASEVTLQGMDPDLRLAAYVEAERGRIVETLFDSLRIPSISSQPGHAADVRRSADFTAALLYEAGLDNVTVLE